MSRARSNKAKIKSPAKETFPRAANAAPAEKSQANLDEEQAPAAHRPTVTICTVTYNRQDFLPLLEKCIAIQTYPHELLDWVVVDDSDNGHPPFSPSQELDIRLQLKTLPERLPLGQKRNLSHTLCKGDIIVYMDDDDWYPPTRVQHAVETLCASDALIAGSTLLPILLLPEKEIWLAGPYGNNHATAGTFAFKRQLLEITSYNNESKSAEERDFLKNYTIPMAQLEPQRTIICIGHNTNTFDKRKLKIASNQKQFRRVTNFGANDKALLDKLAREYSQPARLQPSTPARTTGTLSTNASSLVTPKIKGQINIINPLENPFGGSERSALYLANLLSSKAQVNLWHKSEANVDAFGASSGFQCSSIREDEGAYPRQGTFVFVGFYAVPGDWIFRSNPSRIILIVNTDPRRIEFTRTLSRLATRNAPTELCFASRWIKDLVDSDGLIEYSPIDISTFSPSSSSDLNSIFRVGRLSRDSAGKHHPQDLALYTELAKRDFSCHIMGGTILSGMTHQNVLRTQGITLYPAGHMNSADFLRSLDCFLYRTHPQWIEPHGRVVTEAMACGLPVVAHRRGGYTDFIVNGQNGFLYDSNDEAIEILEKLRSEEQLRRKISLAARRTAESMFSCSSIQRLLNYYLKAP